MTGMPRPTVDTNPVGRHGQIGVDIFARDIEFPKFDTEPGLRPQLDEEVGVVALTAMDLAESPATHPVPRAERPDELPGFYL